jgi:hypothetical protein
MVMKVTPGGHVPDRDVTDYALARWDRTLRLCAIRLSEGAPAFVPLVWLLLRR